MKRKAIKMTGQELVNKLPVIWQQKRIEEKSDMEGSPEYRLLMETATRYPDATFLLLQKLYRKSTDKRIVLFSTRGSLVLFCQYGDRMTFFAYMPRGYF